LRWIAAFLVTTETVVTIPFQGALSSNNMHTGYYPGTFVLSDKISRGLLDNPEGVVALGCPQTASFSQSFHLFWPSQFMLTMGFGVLP
jgi:hypothetical protein